MKSRLFYLLACTALLGLSACSSDDELAQPAPAGTTSVTVTVPSGFASTRADGTSSAQSGYKNSSSTGTVYLSIYKKDGTTRFWNGSQTLGSNGRAEFKNIPVAVGAPVRYVGYATVGSKTLEGGDLQAIPLTNVLNDEEQDCFAGYLDGTTGRDMELTLTRPLCKVRLVATDWKDAQPWEVVVKSVTIKTADDSGLLPATTLNAFSGEMTGAASTTQLASTEDEPYPNYDNESAETDKTLMADYIPVKADANTEVPTPVTIDVAYTTLGGEVQHKVINLTGSGIEGTKTLDPLPLKRNRLITIKGKVFMANADFTVIIDDELDSYVAPWDGTAKTTPTADAEGNYAISTPAQLAGLMDILDNATGNLTTTVTLANDIDMNGKDGLTAPYLNGYNGAKNITIDGGGHTIKGLVKPLIKKTWSNLTLTIKNLTIDASAIQGDDVDDNTENEGVGAVIGNISANPSITLENVHVKNTSVTGGHWTGGIYGYAAGFSEPNNGPVFTEITVTGCSIEGCTVTGKGSAGAAVGHATGDAWTKVTFTGCTFTDNTATSTGSSSEKAGWLVGTVGAAGTETTIQVSPSVGNVSHTGGVYFDGCTQSGNVATSNKTTVERVYGRYGNTTGRIYWDGNEMSGK